MTRGRLKSQFETTPLRRGWWKFISTTAGAPPTADHDYMNETLPKK